MITEDYCSYEVSELLKQKACDEIMFSSYQPKHNKDGTSIIYSTCSHQVATKLLREKGIYIYVQPTKYVGGCLYGFQAVVEDGRGGKWNKSIHHAETHEGAVEAALKYSLENLV